MTRPQFHLTPARGWMNDPHGIVFDGAQYHCFYQYVPDALDWQSALYWGHAVSADLVHWTELEPAIAPLADEVGCWSGSVVLADRPSMLYTRPRHEDWGKGDVVLATSTDGLQTWQRQGVVLAGVPEGFHDFRDPQVRRDGDRWRMTLGAGQPGIGGCALQFSSPDLHHWSYDGILAARAWNPDEEMPTGQVWECPQFLQVDGHWVLIVSAMDAGQATVAEVLYAIGDYDGRRFEPRVWGRFGHHRNVYATTTFTDSQGRACAMSWLRDFPRDEHTPWNGWQSLVHVLHVVDDRLVVQQHPNLDPIVEREDPAWRLTVDVAQAQRGAFCVDVDEDEVGWSLVLDFDSHTMHVTAEDAVTYAAPLRHDVSGVLDIVVDAGIAEVTWSGGEGFYAFAVPDLDPARVDVTVLP